MEPCDRGELALKMFVKGGWRDRWVQIDRKGTVDDIFGGFLLL